VDVTRRWETGSLSAAIAPSVVSSIGATASASVQ
jgi:hypothetical protein